nr:odorant receptor 14 [Psyttalia incisi]
MKLFITINNNEFSSINFVFRMLKLFHSIYTYVLLPQVFISLSMIILQLHLIMVCIGKSKVHLISQNFNIEFLFFKGKQDDGTDAIVAYLFLFAVLLQLLAFCWGGNFILVESERTIDSIYTSHWYNQDRVFRNNLKIFLGAVRKPLTASASSLIDLTAV